MTDADAIEIVQKAIWITMVAAGPTVIATMIVGTIIALLQALTQIQEMTLTFLPKMVVAFIVISLSGSFAGGALKAFAEEMYVHIATGFL